MWRTFAPWWRKRLAPLTPPPKFRRSAAALQGTGKFTKVEVDVNPGANGLRVTFILEPAFYVGMIYFPGATKVFSYQRLLQVVNYPAQEPYQAARAKPGEGRLTRFFDQQGYFEAHVKMEERLDQPRKLADIIYNVSLRPAGQVWKDSRSAGRRLPRSR